jgi:hypothetical protein
MAAEERQKEVLGALVRFIRDELAPGDMRDRFDETTPLLQTGILDSLKTARLVNFVFAELGVDLPLDRFEPETFQDPLSLAAVVCEVEAAAGGD